MAHNASQNPSLDDYRWLVSRLAEPWLIRVEEDRRAALTVAQSLRRDLSAARAHLVLEQVELRRRAKGKFADAGLMFFTKLGLEQSTDRLVANYKSRRFTDFNGCVDLCCGIGGDLAALARRTPAAHVLGVDRDRVAAFLAAANVGELSPHARVVVADAAGFPVPDGYAWHLDPDRRPQGRRTTQLEWHSPDLVAIKRLTERSPHGAIKLAPASDVPDGWSELVELEWISRQRQCRQLVAWLGRLAHSPGLRRATLLRADRLDAEPTVDSITGHPGASTATASDVGRFVYEPDASVLAADLTGELASQHGLARLASGSVYLTSDRAVADPLAACFRVEDVLPFDRKRLRRFLIQRGITRLEIKQRGLPVDPRQLRQELRVSGARTAGEGDAVLILAKRGDAALAILARRIRET